MRRILVCLALLLSAAPANVPWGPAERIATVTHPPLDESSGLAASRRYPGLYWTLNDSGNPASLFLFDPHQGTLKAELLVDGARNIDWEDMTLGPGPRREISYLYIGDIGDNRPNRKQLQVYRLPEPDLAPRAPRPEVFQLRYPEGFHDAEAMVVHPVTGDLYIITKAHLTDSGTIVFKAKAPLQAGVTTLTRIAELHFPGESSLLLFLGRITGGSIAPDGRHLMLCDYQRGWEYTLPSARKNFDAIWKEEPKPVDLGARKQGEAVCYRLDGSAVLATSEGMPMPVFVSHRGR